MELLLLIRFSSPMLARLFVLFEHIKHTKFFLFCNAPNARIKACMQEGKKFCDRRKQNFPSLSFSLAQPSIMSGAWAKSPMSMFASAAIPTRTALNTSEEQPPSSSSSSSYSATSALSPTVSSQSILDAGLIDVGPNLRDRVFAHDLHEVLRRAFAAGVRDLVLTSTEHRSLAQNLDIITRFTPTAGSSTPRMRMTCGIHPNSATTFQNATTIDRMRAFCQTYPQHVVAIGEVTGATLGGTLAAARFPLPPRKAIIGCSSSPDI
jgi:hypothetical protein